MKTKLKTPERYQNPKSLSTMIGFKCTEKERMDIMLAASLEKLTVSEFVRKTLKTHLGID